MITFDNPLKECVLIVGMRQEGKTNLLAYLLSQCKVKYKCFDTMGIITNANFQPLKPKFQTIIKPIFAIKENYFIEICKNVWKEGNQIFAIEEIGQFCTKHYKVPELDSLINLGGNRNIALWFTTRRVAEVHNDVIANCQHHFIFRTYLPQDVEWYAGVVPKSVIEMSKNLPKYHFIYYQIGHEPKIFQPVPKVI